MRKRLYSRIAALFCAAMLLFPASCSRKLPEALQEAARPPSAAAPASVGAAASSAPAPAAAQRDSARPQSTSAAFQSASAEGQNPGAAVPDGAAQPSNAVLPCTGYDAAWLQAWLREPEPLELPEDLSGLLGATMPHYAPMMKLGASLLKTVSEDRQVDTVVILAPNHEGVGPDIELSGLGYFWPYGSVEGDTDAAAFLRACSGVDTAEDRRVLDTEYAASLWAPYIARIFPGARVVTVLFTRGVRTEALGRLADALTALSAEKDIFLLCSIDFSHYQTPEVMAARDRTTRSTAEAGDIPALRGLDGTYLDCPEALSVLLLCGEIRELAYRTLTYQENGKAVGASYFLYGMFPKEGE